MLCALASGLHDPALMLICIYATKSQAVRVCACLCVCLSLSVCLSACVCVWMDGWMDMHMYGYIHA